MGWLTAIAGAVKSVFDWLTKTSRTPAEKEKQQARKEADDTDKKIDESIDRNSRTLW